MNLKPELLTTLTSLGITGTELDTLKASMVFTITSLEAQVSAPPEASCARAASSGEPDRACGSRPFVLR